MQFDKRSHECLCGDLILYRPFTIHTEERRLVVHRTELRELTEHVGNLRVTKQIKCSKESMLYPKLFRPSNKLLLDLSHHFFKARRQRTSSFAHHFRMMEERTMDHRDICKFLTIRDGRIQYGGINSRGNLIYQDFKITLDAVVDVFIEHGKALTHPVGKIVGRIHGMRLTKDGRITSPDNRPPYKNCFIAIRINNRECLALLTARE